MRVAAGLSPGPILAVGGSMFDVCVIGPVVWDRNFYGNLERSPQPGGVAYYASMTYRRLGLSTAVVTKVAANDEWALLRELRSNGVEVFNLTRSGIAFTDILPGSLDCTTHRRNNAHAGYYDTPHTHGFIRVCGRTANIVERS